MDPDVPEQDGGDEVVVTKPSTVTSRGTSLRKIFATTNNHSAPDDGAEGDTIDRSGVTGSGNTEDAEDNAIELDAYETQDDEDNVDKVDKAIEYVAVDTIDKAAKDAVGDDENTEAQEKTIPTMIRQTIRTRQMIPTRKS